MDHQHKKKLSLLKDMIALSKVDNNVSFIEKQFIHSIALTLGITKEELNQIQENNIEFLPQNREIDRISQFYRLVLLMAVDMEHHKKEVDFCKNIGLKMGLNPQAIDEVLNKVLQSKNGMLPPEELIQIFQVYHN